MQNRQTPTVFERGRLRQPCLSAAEMAHRSPLGLLEVQWDSAWPVKRRLVIDCDRPSSEAIHSRVTRAAGFSLADYRLKLKCTSLRGWSLFRGAIPSSARSPESSRIRGATLHLENEPAPS